MDVKRYHTRSEKVTVVRDSTLFSFQSERFINHGNLMSNNEIGYDQGHRSSMQTKIFMYDWISHNR